MIKKILILIVGLAVLYWLSALFYLGWIGVDRSHAMPWSMLQYYSVYTHHYDPVIRKLTQACTYVPAILWLFFALFVLQKRDRALHGDARFATAREVKKAGLLPTGDKLEKTILVGKQNGKYLSYGGYQFVLLAAPTRSGKGVGVVIPNCLNYSDSLVVLDIKGENFEISSGFRAKHGQEVYLFSPFEQSGQTHRYNPIDYISDDPCDRVGDIDAIATALYSGNEKDKFWSENAKDLFRGLCLFVLETPGLPKTIGEILRQASGKGKPPKEYLVEQIALAAKEGRPYSNACIDSLNRVLSNSDNTLAGIIATFNTPLLIFQNPRVDAATSASDFNLRDVRRKRMSIYFKVTPDKLKEASVLVNLFFDQLLNQNTKVLPSQDKSLKYQCLCLLDEMTSIGKVAMINQAVSYMAGYNMRLLTIIQNKSQLEDVYGKAGAVTILSNHALMVMYAPSPVVQSDAQEYSDMLGFETVKARSRSSGNSGNRSTSTSEQRRALMMPQEIRELGQKREIISLENCKPILCEKIRYYEDKNFTVRANLPVPEIPIIDIGTHIAEIEQRVRLVEEADLNDESLVNKIVGLNNLQFDTQSQDDESYLNAFVDNVISNTVEVTESEEKELDAAAESFFDEDDGNDEEVIKTEESHESEDTSVSNSGLSDDNGTPAEPSAPNAEGAEEGGKDHQTNAEVSPRKAKEAGERGEGTTEESEAGGGEATTGETTVDLINAFIEDRNNNKTSI